MTGSIAEAANENQTAHLTLIAAPFSPPGWTRETY
jgi:hypothetical protein